MSATDQRKLTAITLLDLSKAFDSISHRILLTKLQDVVASHPSIPGIKDKQSAISDMNEYLFNGTGFSEIICS